MRRVRSPKRRVRDDDFILGYRRISSNRLSIGGSIQGVSAEILSFKISWQAQYLVRLEGDLIGSAHWKWRFICDADEGCDSFCVAGAVFAEFEGWLYLLHAMERTYPMWCGWRMLFILRGRRSICWVWMVTLRGWRMRFILRGRRSICWVWRVTLLAPRNGNDVSDVMRMKDEANYINVYQVGLVKPVSAGGQLRLFLGCIPLHDRTLTCQKKNRVACWSQLRGVRLVRQRKVSCFECDGKEHEVGRTKKSCCLGLYFGLPQRFSELVWKWLMCEEVDRRGCRL